MCVALVWSGGWGCNLRAPCLLLRVQPLSHFQLLGMWIMQPTCQSCSSVSVAAAASLTPNFHLAVIDRSCAAGDVVACMPACSRTLCRSSLQGVLASDGASSGCVGRPPRLCACQPAPCSCYTWRACHLVQVTVEVKAAVLGGLSGPSCSALVAALCDAICSTGAASGELAVAADRHGLQRRRPCCCWLVVGLY